MSETPEKNASHFRCLKGCTTYPLQTPVYSCGTCGGLLQVVHVEPFAATDAKGWRDLFDGRRAGVPGPDGSGVWRFREWVLPGIAADQVITMGEGGTPLVACPPGSPLAESLDVQLFIKQCGHSLTGSFKDIGMTVLVSQVNRMRRSGVRIPAMVCASTGDTSAALAAYGAAAGIPVVVLLPAGKISAAQLTQPKAHGSRVVAIDTDFDGCMAYVSRLCEEEGIYLANSKNSLRLEGQKTVAFEIAQGLGWAFPDWLVIPGGNLGNVSALVSGLQMLRDSGVVSGDLPRVLCVQAEAADPLYRSFRGEGSGFDELKPVVAQTTHANAIRIGNPVSFPRAVAALRLCRGLVESVSEEELSQIANIADASGYYTCPHTAVALAGVVKRRASGDISAGQSVVVISTAHGLKFTEFKQVTLPGDNNVVVDDSYAAVRSAALVLSGGV